MGHEDHKNKGKEPMDPADETLEFGRAYYASDFPNPERTGCPTADALVRMARSGALPDDEAREHLLSCSPCFIEFRELREEYSGARPAVAVKKAFAAAFSWVGAFVAVILIAFGLYSFAPRSADTSQPVEPAPAARADVTENPSESAPDALKPSDDSSTRPSTRPNETAPTVAFDLAMLAVSRNASDLSAARQVPAGKIRFTVRLRPGSQAGGYSLILFDEFGKSLTSPVLVRSSGKSVSALMDLTTHSGPSRLCVSYGDEVPDCVPLDVVKQKQ